LQAIYCCVNEQVCAYLASSSKHLNVLVLKLNRNSLTCLGTLLEETIFHCYTNSQTFKLFWTHPFPGKDAMT